MRDKLTIITLFTLLLASCRPQSQSPELKTGIQTYTFHQFTLSEALEKSEELGLHYAEAFFFQSLGSGFPDTAYLNFDLSVEHRELLNQKFNDHGITLYAFGVAFYDSEEDWQQFFRFASEMGVKLITAEPALIDLDLVEKLAKQYQIGVAIHNHPAPSVYANPEVLAEALKGRSDLMGVCADIGHWKRVGVDPLETLKKFEGRLKVVHLKDLNEKLEDASWGTGILPVEEVIRELKRQNFDGLISVEYENFSGSQMHDIRQSLKFLNAVK